MDDEDKIPTPMLPPPPSLESLRIQARQRLDQRYRVCPDCHDRRCRCDEIAHMPGRL